MRKLSICLILCFFLAGCGLKEDAPVEEETEKLFWNTIPGRMKKIMPLEW